MTASIQERGVRGLSVPRFVSNDLGGKIGLVLLVAILLVAVLGPELAPSDSNAFVGIPGQGPGGSSPLGLDVLGRDVLSRVLSGGRSTLLLGGAATLLIYAVGVPVGLAAGYATSALDPLLMRTVDVFLSIPALLVMLLFVTAFGGGRGILVLAVVVVLFPGVARIVRAATSEVATKGYVDAAAARGETAPAILRREILPNIMSPLVADLGIRFGWSIILIASVNFLGLGLKPPTSDWGLMISENRDIISINPVALIAPAIVLALLIIAVNLLGDAYVRQLDRSGAQR